MNSTELGRIGEDTAAVMLKTQGYRILERNYHCRTGEVDIIAAENRNIHFIEVKTRRSCKYGRPCEAVSGEKRQRIRSAALCYLTEAKEKDASYERVRFDVIEILINHMEGVF